MAKKNIPIFVAHYGCPHRCVFCNQQRITGRDTNVCASDVIETVRHALDTLRCEDTAEIAFFGGSFTAIPDALQRELLDAAKPFLQDSRICGIRLSTRPDCITEENLRMLQDYGVTSIELGVQSTDEEVLRLAERGHTIQHVRCAAEMIRGLGFELGAQMMIGLPGDTFEKSMQTACDIIALEPDTVRIYPTLVIRETKLYELYLKGSYQPLALDTAVSWCAQLYQKFDKHGIRVLRMGLMASQEIRAGQGVAAGPWHPAFGELVASRLMLVQLQRLAKRVKKGRPLLIRVHPKDVSKVIGQHRCNMAAIADEFGVNVCVKADETVEVGSIV